MKKRSITFGTYRTAEHGWTLSGLKLSDAELKQNYVEKTGGDGAWDLSTALTGGIPRYSNRTLLVNLECSEGTREDRERLINELVNQHDGLEQDIILPDRPDHYLHGRLHVAVDYSDLAHAAVTITANCEPWLYNRRESVVELDVTNGDNFVHIYNRGRRAVVPSMDVTGFITVTFDSASVDLEEGRYKWPALLLLPGLNKLEYTGDGTLTLTYREAVLR